jgi:hypothetical protein
MLGMVSYATFQSPQSRRNNLRDDLADAAVSINAEITPGFPIGVNPGFDHGTGNLYVVASACRLRTSLSLLFSQLPILH